MLSLWSMFSFNFLVFQNLNLLGDSPCEALEWGSIFTIYTQSSLVRQEHYFSTLTFSSLYPPDRDALLQQERPLEWGGQWIPEFPIWGSLVVQRECDGKKPQVHFDIPPRGLSQPPNPPFRGSQVTRLGNFVWSQATRSLLAPHLENKWTMLSYSKIVRPVRSKCLP